ncbi:MAG: hypothetical protein Unbinned8261contig1001_56 [Prokaryotic dsDNA virus sp.]|nr:MAG: hypothetical protein Unbinned8261contig1001_56 [Prokaryotic dsDNA virus sp.]|tara:strand:+ start:5251 stop:5781 length:531 start_codon:yes stop_codon:yes gene_type:complete
MPLITLGDDTELKLQIPSKGDTNWSEDIKTYCFQKIVDHDHTGSSGKGNQIPSGGITDLAVTTGKVAADAITEAKVADDAIQVEHKLTTVLTLDGSAQSLTGLAMSADQAFKITYKINNAAGSSVQVGTAMGQAGDFVTDEFVGTDLSATYSYSTNQLQITGTNTDVLEYSIDFLE